jgi:hypothetical protein
VSGFTIKTDRGQLSPPIAATIYEGRVARTHAPGDALIYGTGPEHRDTDELGNVVNQLPGLKIYIGHPAKYPAAKSGAKVVGTVESGRLDDDTAVARVIITDSEALALIQAGTHELSLGYQCTLDGDRYQRGIKLDHLAIVERARCGPTCALRTDAMTVEVTPVEDDVKIGELEVPVTITVSDETKALLEALNNLQAKKDCGCGSAPDGKVEAPVDTCTCKNHAMPHNNGEPMSDLNNELQGKLDAALAEIAALTEKVTTLEVETVNARKDAEAAQGELEAAKAEVAQAKVDADSAVAKAKTDAAEALQTEINTRVDARVGLIVEAARFDMKDADGNALDLTKLSDREIKCAVIKHVDGDEVPSDKPELFVDGVYSGALKRGKAAGTSRAEVRVAVQQLRKDNAPLSGVDAERASKEKMRRDSASEWAK